MSDPVTVSVSAIAAIAASKFVEKAAEEAGEVVAPEVLKRAGAQVDRLWNAIKDFFGGKKKPEAAAALNRLEQGDETALLNLQVYLGDELNKPQNAAFAQQLQGLVQDILKQDPKLEQNQNQFNIDASGAERVTTTGNIDLSGSGDVVFGDKIAGDKVGGDKVAGDKNI